MPRKYAIIPTLGCLFMLVAPMQGRTEEMGLPKRIKQLRPAVVQILVNGQIQGTGFFVSPEGHVVTALHVIAKIEEQGQAVVATYFTNIEVRLHSGRTLKAQPIPNPAPEAVFHDIALLKVNGKGLSFLRIGSYGDIHEGEESYFMGFPFGVPAATTYHGTVSAKFALLSGSLRGNKIFSDIILIQAPIARGFSGAPLLSQKSKKVIGVVTNRVGGIGPKLEEVRENIDKSKRGPVIATVMISGIDPNESIKELINVLDRFLSAGVGWAVSIDHVRDFLAEQDVLKSQ